MYKTYSEQSYELHMVCCVGAKSGIYLHIFHGYSNQMNKELKCIAEDQGLLPIV